MPHLAYQMQDMAHFKYRINEIIEMLPKSFKSIREVEAIGIPARTFHNDKSILAKSETSIPSDRLRKYADLLGVTMEELYTPTKTKKKSNLKTALS